MKQAKNIIKFAIAIMLLIIIPLIPLTVSEFQDQKLIGSFQVEKVKNNRSNKVQLSDLNISEKLALIGDCNNKEKDIITTTQVRDMSNENITEIGKKINEQVTILQSLGFLQEFNFNESYICYNYTLKRYSNAVEPSENVNLYQVSFSSKNGFFDVLIDADTDKIYQYNYYNHNNITKNNNSLVLFGVKYLGLSEEETYKYLYDLIEDNNESINIISYRYDY